MLEAVSHGCHITQALSAHGPLLWLSPLSDLQGPKAIRGGIPLIAPQFNTFLDGKRHGWARDEQWEITLSKNAVVGTMHRDGLDFELHADQSADTLHVELQATNTSTKEKQIQLGFHPYFLVSDVENVEVFGLEEAAFYDVPTDHTEYYPQPLRLRGEFDRITTGGEAVIVDPGLGRRITVSGQSTDALVVWNPGEALASTMADIPTGGWRQFLCVEPMLLGAGFKGVTVTPGQSLTIGMNAVVESL